MRYTTVDQFGNVVDSGPAAGGGGGGGGGGTPTVDTTILPFGNTWDTNYQAYNLVDLQRNITSADGQINGLANEVYVFDRASKIVSVSTRIDGNVSGTNQLQLYKNSSAFGPLKDLYDGTGNRSTDLSSLNLTFVAGDALFARIQNTTDGNFQVCVTFNVVVG